MEKKKLFYPDKQIQIGKYIFCEGISLKTYSDKKAPFDWGKISFTKEFKEKLELNELDEVSIKLGYEGELEETFVGVLIKNYDTAEVMDEVIFRDRMQMLYKTTICATYLNCSPQEIIRDGLQKAGITQFVLTDTVYQPKARVPIVEKNMLGVLRQINSLWGIDVHGCFIKGIFYWGIKPEQEDILEFIYAENIISLDRAKGMWELVTVSVPSIQHSQMIKVTHPKITGSFEVEKVIFTTNEGGFLRTSIYFYGE